MHAKYEDSISYGLKVIAKVKVDNRQTDKQTDRQTDRQTERAKTICPRSFDPGGGGGGGGGIKSRISAIKLAENRPGYKWRPLHVHLPFCVYLK